MKLRFERDNQASVRDVDVEKLVIAGWAGRDPEAVEKHIAELELLGVKRPPKVPVFYFASNSRVTTADKIEVLGAQTSGEVECALLKFEGEYWIGIGSDHTDRDLETSDVPQSKQICDKPVASTFWSLDDVAAHWDSLKLRSFIVEEGERTLYQDSTVAHLLPPQTLMDLFAKIGDFTDNMMMFCGTASVIGEIRPSSTFEFILEDPVLGRSIVSKYEVSVLPVDE